MCIDGSRMSGGVLKKVKITLRRLLGLDELKAPKVATEGSVSQNRRVE
jgi:hypothetical protein